MEAFNLLTNTSGEVTDSISDVVKPSNGDSDLFGLFSKFNWDDIAHQSNELSQVLSPPDLFSVPLIDAAPVPKDKLNSDASNWGLLSNSVFFDVLGAQNSIFGLSSPLVPHRANDVAANFPTLAGLFNPALSGLKSDAEVLQAQLAGPMPGFDNVVVKTQLPSAPSPSTIAPAPAATSITTSSSKSKKSKRKKGRPELQRKKRSEMNERFKQLKLLCHPDTSVSTVIGRGDRSTNSKEAILRIASTKISRMKKEVNQLEKQVNVRRARVRAQSTSAAAAVSSPSSSNGSTVKTEELDHSLLFRKSAIARIITTLDGTIISANRASAEMLDLNKSQLHTLRKRETVFTLAHAETLPLIFQNLSLLLSGNQAVTYIIDGKGPVTPLNRMAVWSAMSWISSGSSTPSATSSSSSTLAANAAQPVYVESLIVQTGWATPSEAEMARMPLANLPTQSESNDPVLQVSPEVQIANDSEGEGDGDSDFDDDF